MKKQSAFGAIAKCIGYIALFFACQALAGFFAEVAILVGLSLGGNPLSQNMEAYRQVYNGVLYEIMILSALFFFGFLVLMKKKDFFSAYKVQKTDSLGVAGGFFLGFGAYLAAGYLVNLVSSVPAVQESQEAYMETYEAMQNTLFGPWADVIYSCLLAPLVEEVLCRGAILSALKKAFTPGKAIFLSALAFSLIHGNLYQIVFTLPLGLLLGALTHRFSSVWPAVGVHVAFNSSNYLFQLGTFLGYEGDNAENVFLSWAVYLFCIVAVPIALLLLKEGAKKTPPPQKIVFEEHSFVPPAPHPEWVAFQKQKEVLETEGESMASPEFLIVGLGNPGEKYTQNRHNCGFMALDYIALRQNVEFKNLRFKALVAETMLEGKKVLLMKPQTFMNSSGEAVREAAAFYKIPPEKVLVIFDDISFAPGVFRIRKNGSAGGHNGIKSIISCLSSDAFPRVKMGVGNPPDQWELMHWVLGNLSGEDLDRVIASMEDVYSTAKHFVRDDLDRAGALYNGKMHTK